LFVLGEANFSDHGANRLGASALMQGLADGYFVIPYTLGGYLAKGGLEKLGDDAPEVRGAVEAARSKISTLLNINGKRSPASFHRELGKIMWDYCGMARDAKGLQTALKRIPELREEFWQNLTVPGSGETLNQTLEHASRVADFLEFGELMCLDALERNESCGGHFRTEYQTEEGEAERNDADYCYAAAWSYSGDSAKPALTKETLTFDNVQLATRSYK
jgi:succinate dehydrogenase / fumarate reductase flavoprotein subunit